MGPGHEGQAQGAAGVTWTDPRPELPEAPEAAEELLLRELHVAFLCPACRRQHRRSLLAVRHGALLGRFRCPCGHAFHIPGKGAMVTLARRFTQRIRQGWPALRRRLLAEDGEGSG